MISPRAATLKRWYEAPQLMVRELFGATPDGWQDDVLANFPSTPRTAMKASKGPGKAQPKDTVIPTPAGPRRFGDLSVGDEVFTVTGERTTVTAIYDRGVLPVYRVAFDDYSSTLACGEHLWKVRGAAERQRKYGTPYRRGEPSDQVWSILTTDQIITRGVRAKNGRWEGRQFEIPRQGPAQFRGAELSLDPYVLGVWLGDGVRCGGTYATKPTHEIEMEIRDRGYDTSGACNGIVRVYGIAPKLRELGVLHTYSQERFVPAPYLCASENGRRDLLRGLMDTDGGVDKDGHMEFGTTSPRLAQDIMWLVRSLGGAAHQTKVKSPFYYGAKRQRIDGKPCYRVVIRTPFNPFLVPHRKERWVDPYKSRSTARYMTRFIDRIEPEGEADCMCIEVGDPSHLYLTTDFIVTHNSCVMAWLAWNFLLTRPHPNIAATSISADNLRDGLWKEMAHWRNKAPPLQEMFEMQSERIFARESPRTWFMAARSWAKSANSDALGNTLAGLHSDYIMFMIDESGSIPTSITMSAEAALSNCKEGHIIQAGNTNSLEGALYDACVTRRHLWRVVPISGDPDDPKRSSRVSMEWAKEMVATYGRDNPHVKVMVLGEWPAASINALLGPEDIEAAQKRQYQQHDIDHAAKVLGVDVARYGNASSVIFPRQGLVAFKPQVLRQVNGFVGAGRVARTVAEWDVDATFIDNSPVSSSWIDALGSLNVKVIPIDFGGRPHDPRYFNRRAEMHFNAAHWVKSGGALPDDPELMAEATQTTYTFRGDKLIMEPKELVEAKIGRSPDKWDALILTFADPVAGRVQTVPVRRREERYDPIAEFMRTG